MNLRALPFTLTLNRLQRKIRKIFTRVIQLRADPAPPVLVTHKRPLLSFGAPRGKDQIDFCCWARCPLVSEAGMRKNKSTERGLFHGGDRQTQDVLWKGYQECRATPGIGLTCLSLTWSYIGHWRLFS